MKLLLCGEGAHEIGKKNRWDERKEEYVSFDGWMQVLARRLCSCQEKVELIGILKTKITILPKEIAKYKPLPEGHGVRALAAKLLAGREGCKVVVYMLDADTCDIATWRNKKNEVLEGFQKVDNGVIGIACVPMSASEAWFLTDVGAWRMISSKALSLPKFPEKIWGHRDDPNGNHPHRIFARICDEGNVEDCLDTRIKIAQNMDISITARKCPQSFGSFLDDVRTACSDL